MVSINELKSQKKWFMAWIGVCVLMVMISTVASVKVSSEATRNSQMIAMSEVEQYRAEEQLDAMRDISVDAKPVFFLDNYKELMSVPTTMMFNGTRHTVNVAGDRLQHFLMVEQEARQAKQEYQNAVRNMEKNAAALAGFQDQDASEIAADIFTAAATIKQAVAGSEASINETRIVVEEAETDLKAWMEQHPELAGVYDNWETFIEASYQMLQLEQEYRVRYRNAENGLMAVRVNMNSEYPESLSYAQSAATVYIIAHLFLVANLVAAFIILFKNRHFAAMVSKDTYDYQMAELDALTTQLDDLTNTISQTWADADKEARSLDSAMESTEDLEVRMGNLNYDLQENIREEREVLNDLLLAIEEVELGHEEMVPRNRLLPLLQRVSRSTQTLLQDESRLTDDMEELGRIRGSLLGEMKSMQKSIHELRKDSLHLKHQNTEIEETSEHIMNSVS